MLIPYQTAFAVRCSRPFITPRHPIVYASPHASEASTSSEASTLQADCKILDKLLLDLSSTPAELASDHEGAVLSHLRYSPKSFKTFGSGLHKVPKRIYSLEELRLNKVDTTKILSPTDSELSKTRTIAAVAFASLLAAVALGSGERVSLHEAGHLLVAYSVGILPKAVTLSSLESLLTYKSLGVQGGTLFLDSEFQKEVNSGKLSSSSLDKYTCVCLGGVIAEYLCYGEAQGGLNDIGQLDALLRSLGFSQAKSDGEVRWAVLNCAFILREKAKLHGSIAEAIRTRKPSIGELVHMIERPDDLKVD